MPKPIHRSKTTGQDIFVYDQGEDFQLTCGGQEFWFSVWADDPVGSLMRAVEQMALRMDVEVVEFSAPMAA